MTIIRTENPFADNSLRSISTHTREAMRAVKALTIVMENLTSEQRGAIFEAILDEYERLGDITALGCEDVGDHLRQEMARRVEYKARS